MSQVTGKPVGKESVFNKWHWGKWSPPRAHFSEKEKERETVTTFHLAQTVPSRQYNRQSRKMFRM